MDAKALGHSNYLLALLLGKPRILQDLAEELTVLVCRHPVSSIGFLQYLEHRLPNRAAAC